MKETLTSDTFWGFTLIFFAIGTVIVSVLGFLCLFLAGVILLLSADGK